MRVKAMEIAYTLHADLKADKIKRINIPTVIDACHNAVDEEMPAAEMEDLVDLTLRFVIEGV